MTISAEIPIASSAAGGTEPTGLAARLRAETELEHRAAESRGFMVRLMGGELDLGAYTRYLAQFVRVYEAMEARVPAADDPALLADRRVHRAASARADLAALGAPEWRDRIPALPATAAYVRRLQGFGEADGLRHLAHHYTRYLGDLSGGQVIATMLRRHYGASEEQLAFYRFEGIDQLVPYKRDYRAALDGLQLGEHGTATVLAEARIAFEVSAAIFDELAGS